MLRKLLTIISLLLMCTACSTSFNNKKTDPNLPKKPYSEWRIGGSYPHYFPATVFSTMIKTQSNQYKIINIVVSDNNNDKDQGQWQTHFSIGALPYSYDLPEVFYICWSSFADQTFYRTTLTLPLWARQAMVTPHQYYSYASQKEDIGYYDSIIIGFAPGGSVTGWLAGVPQQDVIEFGKGVTQRIPQGSEVCPNPYPNGKITEITEEAKAWLKKHGMPKAWQEKNNNVTMGPDFRFK